MIEIHARQPYAINDGRADPCRYPATMADDRGLRFDGSKVYHVGGTALQPDTSPATTERLFTRLFARHGVA